MGHCMYLHSAYATDRVQISVNHLPWRSKKALRTPTLQTDIVLHKIHVNTNIDPVHIIPFL